MLGLINRPHQVHWKDTPFQWVLAHKHNGIIEDYSGALRIKSFSECYKNTE